MPQTGEPAPSFSLPDTSDAMHSPDGAPATVVVFTCNHCPYALAWHERIGAVARDYAAQGVKVLAINPNDAERYPRDSSEAMRARVQAGEFDGVPYLRDETQEVARAYDAKNDARRFRARRRRGPALSRRSRRRLRRALPERRIPACGARRGARRAPAGPGGNGAGGLLDQVEGRGLSSAPARYHLRALRRHQHDRPPACALRPALDRAQLERFGQLFEHDFRLELGE